ncbi:sulfotransferase family protein [Cereibacter azotoformans]|uniref:sulfotransferase family protein n=1 Tax=Cereibacter azotoformans TaxID=43057 RepID=UPI000C6DDC36|nr:sulfotransferase family protein [Cereibacter azotoformans]
MPLDQASPPRIALVVLGMHRSGTSALAGVLGHMGCDLPQDLMPGNEANPRGHFESLKVYYLNDAILASAGSAWDDWSPVSPDLYRSPRLAEFRLRAAEVLAQEFGDSSLIVLKDPRICRLLPFWTEALAEAGFRPLYVCTHRAADEVAASLTRREGWPASRGRLLWLRHVLEAEAGTREQPRVFVSYEALLSDWRATVARIAGGLGLQFPRTPEAAAPAILDFLADDLRHFRSDGQRAGPELPDWIRRPQEILGRWAASGERPEDRAELDAIEAELDRALPMLRMIAGDAAPAQGAPVPSGPSAEEGARRAADRAAQAMLEEELALLRRAQADAEARLRHASAHLEAMTRRLSGEMEATLSAELSARARLPEVEAARAALQREVADLRESLRHKGYHVAELERHAGQLAERVVVLERQQGELERQLSEATLQIAELEARHAAIMASTSWKVTRPMRSAIQMFHRPKQTS